MRLPKIRAIIRDDSAPCGRNAQTLSGPEGSSNRDAYNRRGIRVLKVFFQATTVAFRYTSANRTNSPYDSSSLSGYLRSQIAQKILIILS